MLERIRSVPGLGAPILTFTHTLTVGSAAIDANGHVNNVMFVQWMQDAAIAHSDAVGALPLTAAHHALWVVRSHHIEYKRQAFLGDVLEVRTWIVDCRLVSSRRTYEFHRVSSASPLDSSLKPAESLLAKGETDWVLIDAATFRPKAIPEEIQRLYLPAEGA